jgi:hypothetical protein
MKDELFCFKSEHPDYPDDIYLMLKNEHTKEYIEQFPVTGRVVGENDPEIECILDEPSIYLKLKNSEITIELDIRDLVDKEYFHKDRTFYVFLYKKYSCELLSLSGYYRIFVDEV